MAIALTWDGRVDLDLNFDEFFDSDHTISAWFMPQFPDSYINPIVAVGPSKTVQLSGPQKKKNLAFYVMGTGEFQKGSTHMFLRVGDVEKHYGATFHANKWHHVAVVRKGNIFRMYIDSVALVDAINTDVKAPKNNPVRLGQTVAWPEIYEKRFAQFYGLIDDVAVFNKALTDAEIAELKKKKTITGDEPSLLAAWLFSKKAESSPKLKRKFTMQGGISKVFEAQPRDKEKDKQLQLLPGPKFRFKLPLPKNQLIYVGQGPHDLGMSHSGARNFPFDFAPIEMINPTGDPAEGRVRVDEVPFHAVSNGTVDFIQDDQAPGKFEGNDTNSMFVSIDGMPGFFWKHLHWKAGSAKVKTGDKVKVGDVLALASDSGVGIGNFHLHTALVFFPDGQKPPDKDENTDTVSVPVAFTNFQRLKRVEHENGDVEDIWEVVDVDVPRRGDILVVPSNLEKMKFFEKPLIKLELSRFRDLARRRRIGIHDVRNEM
jgi:hypothetical protein